jgi:hypothetical protein
MHDDISNGKTVEGEWCGVPAWLVRITKTRWSVHFLGYWDGVRIYSQLA